MHELPITKHIIEIAEAQCREAGGSRVRRIGLVIGENSGYVGSSIELYFETIADGTLCEDAALDITEVKAKLRCTQCGKLFTRELFSFACPDCGGDGVPSEIGKEFYIDNIEIDVDDTQTADKEAVDTQAGGEETGRGEQG